jgi:hypothetical protein
MKYTNSLELCAACALVITDSARWLVPQGSAAKSLRFQVIWQGDLNLLIVVDDIGRGLALTRVASSVSGSPIPAVVGNVAMKWRRPAIARKVKIPVVFQSLSGKRRWR